MFGILLNRHGMAVCPFHNDKNPSMKVDKRFHCFACQADGDAVDFVSRLFGLPSKAAAIWISACKKKNFLVGSPLAQKKRDPFSIIFYDFRNESGKNSEPYPLVKSGETPFR